MQCTVYAHAASSGQALPGRQDFFVLGSNTLAELKVVIACPHDRLQQRRSEPAPTSAPAHRSTPIHSADPSKISDQPDPSKPSEPVEPSILSDLDLAPDIRTPCFFKIEDKILGEPGAPVDKLSQWCADPIRAAQAGCGPQSVGQLCTTFSELYVRLGSKYLFAHGDKHICTHAIVFSEMRVFQEHNQAVAAEVVLLEQQARDAENAHQTALARAEAEISETALKHAAEEEARKKEIEAEQALLAAEKKKQDYIRESGDSDNPFDYPKLLFQSKSTKVTRCRVCKSVPAAFVTVNDRFATSSPFFYCAACFDMLQKDVNGAQVPQDDGYKSFEFNHPF